MPCVSGQLFFLIPTKTLRSLLYSLKSQPYPLFPCFQQMTSSLVSYFFLKIQETGWEKLQSTSTKLTIVPSFTISPITGKQAIELQPLTF